MKTNKFKKTRVRKSKKIQKTRKIKRKTRKIKKTYGGAAGLAALGQAGIKLGEAGIKVAAKTTNAAANIATGAAVGVGIAGVGIKEAIINSSTVSFGILNNSIKLAGDVNTGLFGTLKTIYRTGELAGLIVNKLLDTCARVAVNKIKELDEISAKYLVPSLGYNRNNLYPNFLKTTYSDTYKHYNSLFYSIKNLLKTDKLTASSHLLQLKCSKDWRWNVTCSKIDKLFDKTEPRNGLYADKLYAELKNKTKILETTYKKYIIQFNIDYNAARGFLISGFTAKDIYEKNDKLKIYVSNFMNKYNISSKDIPEIGIKKAQIYSSVFDPIITKSSELLKKISELSLEDPNAIVPPKPVNDQGKIQIQEIEKEKSEIDAQKNIPIKDVNLEEISKKYSLAQRILKGIGIGKENQEKPEVEVPGEVTEEEVREVTGQVTEEVPGQVSEEVPGQVSEEVIIQPNRQSNP